MYTANKTKITKPRAAYRKRTQLGEQEHNGDAIKKGNLRIIS